MKELKQDGKFALLVGKEEWQEIPSKRTESGKTYALNGDAKQKKKVFVAQVGVRHYKDDYNSKDEQWKDIDLTWEKNRITKAPYELTLDGQKITVKCKKTGEVSTIELLEVKPSGLKWEIVPQNTSINFRHILPTGEMSFEAKFRVEGKIPLKTRAFDDEGELELETTFKNGILTEKLSQAKDKNTGEVRATKGSIRIDPTLDVAAHTNDGDIGRYGSNYVGTRNYNDYDFQFVAVSQTFLRIGQMYETYYHFNRAEIPFDTSALEGEEIISAELKLYGHTDYSDTDFDITVVEYTGNVPITNSDSDFVAFGSTSGGALNTSGFSTTGYNSITLNATGLGWINKTGTTVFGLRSSRDIGSNAPSGDEWVLVYSANESDSGKRPKLVIVYEDDEPEPDTGTGESHITATSQLTTTAKKQAKAQAELTAISKLTATGRKVAQAQVDIIATSELTATGQKHEAIPAPTNFQAQQINGIIRLSWEVG